MITTGSPSTSFLATCGNEPSDCAPPFGGRHGTRLKISPADFAAAFTLSIAVALRVLDAAALPACGEAAGCGLAWSVACGAACAAFCACAADIETWVNNRNAA